jgi:hypothetical protein
LGVADSIIKNSQIQSNGGRPDWMTNSKNENDDKEECHLKFLINDIKKNQEEEEEEQEENV